MELVVADVDAELGAAVNAGGGKLTLNIAHDDRIEAVVIDGVKVLNPTVEADREELVEVAARATEICTALPSVKIYPHVTPWLKEGMERASDPTRFIYTAENDVEAAHKFSEALGQCRAMVEVLNSVIGKMSGIVDAGGVDQLDPLCPGYPKAHLVERFSDILIDSPEGIDAREVQGLRAVSDLFPFEEAKLFGHNATHYFMGWEAHKKGYASMDEIREDEALMAAGLEVLVEESGQALVKRYLDQDPLFTSDGFGDYAKTLVQRMVNPYLRDLVERIIRDPNRKLGWNDRVIGAIRMIQGEGFQPKALMACAAEALGQLGDLDQVCPELWGQPWDGEKQALMAALQECKAAV